MEPHTVLGVSANASAKDINDAFRALVSPSVAFLQSAVSTLSVNPGNEMAP